MPHWLSLSLIIARRPREPKMDLPQAWTTQVQQRKEAAMLALVVTTMKAVSEAKKLLRKWPGGCQHILRTHVSVRCAAVLWADTTSTFCNVRSWKRCHQRRQEHCTSTWVRSAKNATLNDILLNVAPFRILCAGLKLALGIGRDKCVGASCTTLRFILMQKPKEKHSPRWATIM